MRFRLEAFTAILLLFFAGPLATGAPPAWSQEKPSGQRLNVLFIAIDDLNDWVGCLGGHPQSQTPNIDRLASQGVSFTRAYCSAPACNPSRISLLTGLRPSTSGVYHNSHPWRPALNHAVTLPMHFRNRGYHVAGRGKIYHGGNTRDPEAWDDYEFKEGDPKPPNPPVNGIPNAAHFDWGPLEVEDEEMGDTRIALWAEEFLSKDHEKPFFLACGFVKPHLPWYVPKKYFDLYPTESVTLPTVREDDLEDVPDMGRHFAKADTDHKRVIETNNWKRAVAGYLATIRFCDTNVGRVLDALKKSRYADNTLIVLWGDHGWHLGEKQHWRKFALWEEATRVPLIFAGPGIPREKTSGRTVSLLDLSPTLAELCGLPALAQWEAKSFAKLVGDPEAEWDRPAITTHGRNHHSVRTERWRYIRYEDGGEELYDHEKDPLEWTNLAGDPQFSEVKEKLAQCLQTVNAPEVSKEN